MENERSLAAPAAASSAERRSVSTARVPGGTGCARARVYEAASARLVRSTSLIRISSGGRRRPPETPGRGRSSSVTIFASIAGGKGSLKVSVISSKGSRPSAPSPGTVATGASRSVASVAALPPAGATRKRESAGHGSAGRNCSVLASSQRNAPGWEGWIVTKRSARSSGPPAAGPRSDAKKTVTGSHRRSSRSGTTRGPVSTAPSGSARRKASQRRFIAGLLDRSSARRAPRARRRHRRRPPPRRLLRAGRRRSSSRQVRAGRTTGSRPGAARRRAA